MIALNKTLRFISEHSLRASYFLFVSRLCRTLRLPRLPAGPPRLDIIATHRCNLKCEGCVHDHHDGAADLEIGFFNKIVDESKFWVTQYQFCSVGEPFVNKNFLEILGIASHNNIGCTIATNGMLVSDSVAKCLVSATKTEYLTFSIDGANKATCEGYRRGLDFEKLLSNISGLAEAKKALGAHKPVIGANFVAMRSNIEELPDFIRLAKRIGIETINVNYATIEGGLSLKDSLFSYQELQQSIFSESIALAKQLGIFLRLPPDLTLAALNKGCIFPWDCMIIDTNGAVRMCYFSWEKTIGNILTDGGIKAVWNNKTYRKVRASLCSASPWYRYCALCGRQNGFSKIESHIGKNTANANIFSFCDENVV